MLSKSIVRYVPALVMEERRPPPVEESWAATSEPAVRRTTCENFMVIYVVGDVVEVW